MKLQTPMKSLKGQAETFASNIYSLDIEITELQHREERIIDNCYNRYEEYPKSDLKEIESDFIRIYSIEDTESSFAFKYTYLDSKKKNIIEDQFFEIIFKDKEVFESSKLYTIEEARTLLKSVNKILKQAAKLTSAQLVKILKDNCCFSKEELLDQTEKFKELLENESKELLAEYLGEVEKAENYQSLITTGTKNYNNYIESLPESIELIKLKKMVYDLESSLSIIKREKFATYDFGTLKNNLSEAKENTKTLFEKVRGVGLKVNNVTRISIKKMDSLIGELTNRNQ
jgi:hypothetical protein